MRLAAPHFRPLFVLFPFKFVGEKVSGKFHLLKRGWADAFCARIVLQEVDRLTAVDFDHLFVQDAIERMGDRWKFECKVHDILEHPVPGEFDGAYSLDVLEHIPQKDETRLVSNIAQSLTAHGTLMIGTPSIRSQVHASPGSREGHVNCKDHKELKELMSRFFHHVFVFSMNDEVVHTGFYSMAHYLFALCCSKKPA